MAEPGRLLAPGDLAAQLEAMLAAAEDLVRGAPRETLDRTSGHEALTVRDRAYRIFRVGVAFADAMDFGRFRESWLDERAPADLEDGGDVARYAALACGRLAGWLDGASAAEYLRIVDVPSGRLSCRELLAWITASVGRDLRELRASLASVEVGGSEYNRGLDLHTRRAPMKIAERMSRLGTESAFEVLARARALERQGKEIIHLEIGEPDFDTPAHIREAAKRALDSGATHYGPAAGLPELREAIAKDVAATRNIPVTADEIVVTPGAKPIMYFVITALVNPGDEVIYPNPGFPIYESVINFVGGVPVPIPLKEESGFGFDLDLLERKASARTRLIIVNSPQNPTGGVLEVDQLGRIAEVARRYQIPVLADEIYKSFLYDGEFASITRFPGMRDLVIILDGFSKAYAMTGWRLGYGVMPADLAEHVARLMVNSNSCTASFTQLAGIEALQGDQTPVARMVAEFKRRRDLTVQGLNALPGVSCRSPRGAFYCFPNVKALGRPSREIAEVLLNEAGVAVLGGTAFGEHGEGYLRLSYANSEENLRRALDRMRPVLARLAGS